MVLKSSEIQASSRVLRARKFEGFKMKKATEEELELREQGSRKGNGEGDRRKRMLAFPGDFNFHIAKQH